MSTNSVVYKEFNKPNCIAIRKVIEAHLNQIREETGVDIKLGKIGYQPQSFRAKLEASVMGFSQTAQDYKDWCHLYDLDLEWLGKTYKSGGRVFKIVGLKMKARKNTVQVESEGKQYITSHEIVALHMGGPKVTIDPTVTKFEPREGSVREDDVTA